MLPFGRVDSSLYNSIVPLLNLIHLALAVVNSHPVRALHLSSLESLHSCQKLDAEFLELCFEN